MLTDKAKSKIKIIVHVVKSKWRIAWMNLLRSVIIDTLFGNGFHCLGTDHKKTA